MRDSLPLTPLFIRILSLLALLAAFEGCSRGVNRRWADREAYGLIGAKAERVGISDDGWGLDRGPESRLYDPENKDHPGMPPDDPASAELMRTHKRARRLTAQEETEWRRALPGGGKGEVILQMRDAVEVAIRNSHQFQSAREDLYLTALDLSEERYKLRPHFALGTTGSHDLGPTLPDGTVNKAGLETTGALNWMTAFGGQILASAANTIIWDFDRPNLRLASSLLKFTVIQPLMRFGGRARTLEPLTQKQRTLLANVRRMEQFQQGFYLNIVAGRSAGSRPVRSATTTSAPALLAGSPSGVGGIPSASGFLGLLEEQQRIRNFESNVAGLRSSLAQLEAAFEAGRASSMLQVLQARQALQNAQSNLLTARAGYQTRLDTFKAELGLPPSLPLDLRDSLLNRFTIFDPATTTLQNQVTDLSISLQDRENLTTPAALQAKLTALRLLQPHFDSRFAAARGDVTAFREALPGRMAQFERLTARSEVQQLGLQSGRFDPANLGLKAEQIDDRLDALAASVAEAFAEIDAVQRELPALELAEARARASAAAANLSGYVLRLSLDRAGSRIETVTLPNSDLNELRAMEIARANRLDWMNARAELVDAWRQIDYNANPLMSGVDLQLDAALDTPNTGHQSSVHFDARNGSLAGALRIDTPLDRLRERNDYREALADYQGARRSYMDFEDNVNQSLRNTLRLVQLSHLNFEFRRSAVQTALAQVDLARLKLDEPPKPGQSAQLGVTAARDLVSALSDLLDAQNSFLSLWVGSEVLRMELDYELGLMEIDDKGHWVEPGPFTQAVLQKRLAKRVAAGAPLAMQGLKPKQKGRVE